jgi:hypothetical protein
LQLASGSDRMAVPFKNYTLPFVAAGEINRIHARRLAEPRLYNNFYYESIAYKIPEIYYINFNGTTMVLIVESLKTEGFLSKEIFTI